MKRIFEDYREVPGEGGDKAIAEISAAVRGTEDPAAMPSLIGLEVRYEDSTDHSTFEDDQWLVRAHEVRQADVIREAIKLLDAVELEPVVAKHAARIRAMAPA